jgi:hypothetical protein
MKRVGAIFIILPMVLTRSPVSWITILLAGTALGQEGVQLIPNLRPTAATTPMTPGEKLRYNMVHSVQLSDFFQTAVGSALAQWRDAPYEWGQGWGAYGHRYGSRFAQHLVKRAVLTGVQMADGEDPRRLRSVRSGIRKRTYDAVKYTFVSQRDDGSLGFAYSRLISCYAAGFISRSWHPSRLHNFAGGMSAGSLSLGVETGMSVLNEFLPDILHKLHVRRK